VLIGKMVIKTAPADLPYVFQAEKLCAKHGFLWETLARVPTGALSYSIF